MDIKECHPHGKYHRNEDDACHKADNEEHGTGKFAEDGQHQGHITSKAEYARIGQREFVEVGHLVKTMHKEEYAEKEPDKKQNHRHNPVSEILGKQKIVKHSIFV